MGQQQILILVLSIVLVSVAVYIGIDFFGNLMRQRHADLLVNHGVHIASEAVTWRTKTTPFLGGGGTYSDLDTDGMEKLLMDDERLPGRFAITRAVGDELEVTGVSTDFPEIGIRVYVEETDIVNTEIAYDGSITLPSPP